jgi:hypothetical protein
LSEGIAGKPAQCKSSQDQKEYAAHAVQQNHGDALKKSTSNQHPMVDVKLNASVAPSQTGPE